MSKKYAIASGIHSHNAIGKTFAAFIIFELCMVFASLTLLLRPAQAIGGPPQGHQVPNLLFNRSAHSAGPEFRIWSSELGITGPRDCPQTVYMLQINADWTPSGAQISGKKIIGILEIPRARRKFTTQHGASPSDF